MNDQPKVLTAGPLTASPLRIPDDAPESDDFPDSCVEVSENNPVVTMKENDVTVLTSTRSFVCPTMDANTIEGVRPYVEADEMDYE